jgi:outer membrane protein TolC
MFRPPARAALLVLLGFATLAGSRAEEPAGPPAPATPAAPAGSVLTIEDCIARALQKNFTLKIQDFSTDIARESLNEAKAAFEPTFTATATRAVRQQSASTSTLDGSTTVGPRSDTTDTRIGVSQPITTGATIGLSASLDRSATNSTYSILNPAFDSDVALTVSQPLLRGAGTAVNRATIERTKLGVSIAGLDFESQVLQVVRDTEAAYYNLVFAREQKVVKQHSLELAQQLYDENKNRKAAGVATDLDVLSAEVGVANARNGVLTADQTVRNNEDALLALIGQFELGTPLGDVHLPADVEPAPSFDYSYKLARDNQPDFLATKASIQQLKIDTDTAKNFRLPSLDLGGALGFNGTDRTYGRAFDRVKDADGYNWEVDLSLSVPWGLHAGKARYRSAQASLRQQQARLQQVEQNLLVQVRAGVRAVETSRQSVVIFGQATELAEKQYELELARFKAGLSTSRQVLQTQDDLEAARLNELQARVDLRIAYANLHQLETSSLPRYHIALAK